MEFGTLLWPVPSMVSEQAKWAEEQGFTHAWIGDVPIAGGADVFVSLALAAKATSKIKLGTYIAPAPLRDPTVVVSSIGTINALAPGRTILGFGSGSFSLALMGLPPMKLAEFRAQAQTIRGLLDGGDALWEKDGFSRKIRFFNRQLFQAFSLEPKIPFYIAASAPKAAAMAGKYADGLITTGAPLPGAIASLLDQFAAAAGMEARPARQKIPCIMEGPICVLHPGESMDSPRVFEIAQFFVMTAFRSLASQRELPEWMVPSAARPAFRAYLDHVESMKLPVAERHLAVWEGVFMPNADERRFVTPEAIRAMTITGKLEEVVDTVRALERAGLTQLNVWLPTSGVDEYLADLRSVQERL
jgi:alkanesulfonate monooxygenase SsuD/methylene tetrahydromethanopterin reductase-like flavin-dependent oxidoreductase (luciferase family)